VKLFTKKRKKISGFTIVELLTVMSIITILISLLVPALTKVRKYSREVKQRAQFHSIDVALELFNSEFEGYPPSSNIDPSTGIPLHYVGAMKLAEAMVGQDKLGFHPDSMFNAAGRVGNPPRGLYLTSTPPPPNPQQNLDERKDLYLQLENANAYTMHNLYGPGNTGNFDAEALVLCDVYKNVRLKPTIGQMEPSGRAGMPILYYRANTSGIDHTFLAGGNPNNIYHYLDNQELVDLPMPETSEIHPMASMGTWGSPPQPADPSIFYDKTQNETITSTPRPYRAKSYILISAGYDGKYGTSDDILNFKK